MIRFLCNNKNILLRPIIVWDEEQESEFEGICFMINKIDNYCNLTIEEAEYLYYILDTINLIDISKSMLEISMLSKHMGARKLELPKQTINERQVQEDITTNFSTKKIEDTIPDLK